MITPFQFQQMQDRLARARPRGTNKNIPSEGVEEEVSGLHYPIIKWCKAQWPPVPYVHARTDVQSTIAPGAPDFVLFYQGTAILLECKTKSGKISRDQEAWHRMASDQKFPVFIIRSMDDFYALIKLITRHTNESDHRQMQPMPSPNHPA